LVVSTSAIDCLERLVSEMTYYVSSGTLNPTHSLTHSYNPAVRFSEAKASVPGASNKLSEGMSDCLID